MITQYDLGVLLIGYAAGLSGILFSCAVYRWWAERKRKQRLSRGPYWR